MKLHAVATTLTICMVLAAGCSVHDRDILDRDGAPTNLPDMSHVPDAVPLQESLSRYGNPAVYEVFGTHYRVMQSSRGYIARGLASWYGTKFHGRRTSSGEPYDMYAMTAAHKHLPLPTYVRVRNLENGRSTVVRVNDRGPFHDDRLIDLSYAAASKLGVLRKGTALVEIQAIDPATDGQAKQRPPSPRHAPTARTNLATAPAEPNVFLQAGAFSDHANAVRLRNRLEKSLAREVRVYSPHDGSGLHRVRIGPLATREHADSVASQLHHMGVAGTRVVVD